MKRFTLLVLLAVTLGVQAQQGSLRGRVVDARSGENIEYANIALLKAADSSLVNGTVSESNGSFRLTAPYGRYLVRVTFIGYDAYFHAQPVVLGESRKEVNLGKLQLRMSGTMMEAVEVTAERSMVEYQLDKRVVNVDKNIVAGGGTATDVLEQVPSVAIDNDGNVTLRGSTNVKVLVNGRPSELLASDLSTLLEQIPASTVENVEVITNPSAKYDPEGMSGIINIKLKDRTAGALGLNGVASLNMGAPVYVPSDMQEHFGFADYATLMGNVSLNYTTEKYNLFFNADGGQRARGNYGTSDIEYLNADGTSRSHYLIDQYSVGPGRMGSVKVGGEYYFDKHNSLLLSYQLRAGNRRRKGEIRAALFQRTAQPQPLGQPALHPQVRPAGRGVHRRLHLQRPQGGGQRHPGAALFRQCPLGELLQARKRDPQPPSGAQRQAQLRAPHGQRLAPGDWLRGPHGLARPERRLLPHRV